MSKMGGKDPGEMKYNQKRAYELWMNAFIDAYVVA